MQDWNFNKFNKKSVFMMKKLILSMLCAVMSIGLLTAQTTRVTGTVISSDDGEPVIGASIQVKGTTTGTVTNYDGTFELTVPASAKSLIVSYVGMQTKELTIQTNMRIILDPDTHALGEVMVVAYGTTKKESFTGSAAVVSNEKIEKRLISNISKALEGQVSGWFQLQEVVSRVMELNFE